MLRGPLGKAKYKPKFSGHDTFPFRYAWLTKIAHYLEDGDLKKIKENTNVPLIGFAGGAWTTLFYCLFTKTYNRISI